MKHKPAPNQEYPRFSHSHEEEAKYSKAEFHLLEEQLLECEQLLEATLEIADLGIWKLSLGTNEVYSSARGKTHLGYPADTNVTYTMLDERIISAVDSTGQPVTGAPKIVQTLLERLQTEEVYQAEHQVKWPDDTPHWIEVCSKALSHKNGKIGSIIVITHDITKRKQEQQHRNTSLSKVRHELKTPLTTIKGFTQLLRRRMKKQGLVEYGEMLTRIEEQVDIMDKLINAMKDLSSLQNQAGAGSAFYAEQPFSLLSNTEPSESSGDIAKS
jgi:phospho-acceptor domain-containing protein